MKENKELDKRMELNDERNGKLGSKVKNILVMRKEKLNRRYEEIKEEKGVWDEEGYRQTTGNIKNWGAEVRIMKTRGKKR